MTSVFMGTPINYLLVNLEMLKKSNNTLNKNILARTLMKISIQLFTTYYHWLHEEM